MTAAESYKNLLENLFGPGSATFSATEPSNNITGALLRTDGFGPFREGFNARLARLAVRYPSGDANRQALLEAVNNIARSKNWPGAYSELVALDYFNSDTDWLGQPIELNRKVSAVKTLGSAMGMSNVDFDGYYEDFDVLFDVKVLQDKVSQSLQNVIKGAKKAIAEPEIFVQPEFQLDMDFGEFDGMHSRLIQELAEGLKGGLEKGSVKSALIAGLSYRYRRTGGSLSSVSTYDPYEHANNHHRLLFQHAKKFSRDSPSIIVFVVFPWFSESVLRADGLIPNELFYRAFCRRFFCQYAKDGTSAGDQIEDFDHSVTMAEVTSCLSGVIFVEDHSILEGANPDRATKAFAYFNPNARNKPGRHYRDHLVNLGIPIDDFGSDNY